MTAKDDTYATDDKLVQAFKHTVFDSLLRLFETETNKYLELSTNLRSELQAYTVKMSQEDKTINRSFFLFESIDTSTKLFNYVEQNLEEDQDIQFRKKMDQVLIEARDQFGLKEAKNENTVRDQSEESKILGKISLLIVKPLQKKLVSFFQKNRLPENYSTNYIINKVVITSIDSIQDILDMHFSCSISLLGASWNCSNTILKKVERVIENDYQLPENKEDEFYNFKIDDSEVVKLEAELTSSYKNLEKSLRESMQNNFAKIQEEKFIIPEDSRTTHKLYNRLHTLRLLNKGFKNTSRKIHNWQNSIRLQSDDWLLDLEIARLKYYILFHGLNFGNYVRSKFIKPIDDSIVSAHKITDELIKLFEENSELSASTLPEMLTGIRLQVKRKMVLRMIPDVKKIILESNIPAHIDEFEQGTAQQFKQLSKSRSITKNAIYTKPIENHEIDKISPLSLVSFQMMPDFMSAFPLLKQGFTRHLQDIQTRIEELPEIISYSLNSTLDYLAEKKNLSEAEKIGLDGIKRAENKINDVKKLMDEFISQETEKLNTSLGKLTENLSEITDNESAINIKIRIAKAKTINKSKEFRNKLLNYFKDFIPETRLLIERLLAFLHESSLQIRKQFTLQDKKGYISTDVSDYLTETEHAVNKLPFIYQRLFKSEALTSFELYTERDEELEKLKTAYSRWKLGKFAPTVILGEKGWGKTTLINRFMKLRISTEEVIHIQPDSNGKMEELFESIESQTTVEISKSEEEELGQNRKIVILDGLEKLFEVRINGFGIIMKFLQHISDSNPNFFWIISCHLHSWQYLDKTVSIADYFGYHIKLSDFPNEVLMKTIERRHVISGYRLMFLPETQKKSLISFKKQSDFGDQSVLREEYFNRMHKIVKGNLSQAFLFWMRSTAYVTEDTVYIEYLNSEYFHFLGSMSDSKLIMLKYIVLHNGLTIKKFAMLLRFSEEKSRLYLGQLCDDGILVINDQHYNVNPIIYRQITEQLYLLNILH